MTGPRSQSPELHIVPAFLRACRATDNAATALMLGALLLLGLNFSAFHGCLAWQGGLIAASLLVGVVEKYFALRVRFDVRLFEAVAAGDLDYQSLDAGIARLFPGSAPPGGRDRDIRIRGAMGLARRQLTAFALQTFFLSLAAALPVVCR